MLPQPVIALLLLFPITDQSEAASKAGKASPAEAVDRKQTVTTCFVLCCGPMNLQDGTTILQMSHERVCPG